MNIYEKYTAKLRDFTARVAPFVTARDTELMLHFIDNGENGEALILCAWAVAETRAQIPLELMTELKSLSEDIVDPKDFPPDLDSYVRIDEGPEQ
jgi:hypothetical protein